MKNVFVLISVLMLLFIVACAPAAPKVDSGDMQDDADDMKASEPAQKEDSGTTEQKSAPEPEKETVSDSEEVGRTPPKLTPPSEKTTTTETKTETAPTQDTSELSPKIRDLIKRKEEKLKSLQFLYGGTETRNLFLDTFLIKDGMIKIKKFSEDYYVQDGYYDTIYLNEGIACCEEQARCKSHNVDNSVVKFEVDPESEKVPMTPMEWMDKIKPNAKVVGPQTVDERSVTYLKYTNDQGQEVFMWVDDTYGVPHKVEIHSGEDMIARYQFNDMRFNSLKDEDFVPPCKDLPTA